MRLISVIGRSCRRQSTARSRRRTTNLGCRRERLAMDVPAATRAKSRSPLILSNRPRYAKSCWRSLGISPRLTRSRIGRVGRSPPRTASLQPMPSSWSTRLNGGYRSSPDAAAPSSDEQSVPQIAGAQDRSQREALPRPHDAPASTDPTPKNEETSATATTQEGTR